jgi:hypothetical protein
VVLPPQRRRRPPPYTGKVLKAKSDTWHHGLSPSSRQDQLESLLNGLRRLATAASAVPPGHVPVADQVPMVEVLDDDAPPPEWGQWENWPATAPEPAAGVLVVREDSCVVPRQPTHGAEASSHALPYPPQMSPSHARSRGGSTPAHHRPTSMMPRPSRRCGRSSETTAPRSTTR